MTQIMIGKIADVRIAVPANRNTSVSKGSETHAYQFIHNNLN